MNNYRIGFAKSINEVEDGLKLFSECFPGDAKNNYEFAKARSKILISDYHFSQCIVAYENKHMVGFLRYGQRKMRLGGIDIDIIGIGDYCAKLSNNKTPFFGVEFLCKSLDLLRDLEFPFAIGNGRRAMANYYHRFGFITASNYAKCYIEKIPKISTKISANCNIAKELSSHVEYEKMRRWSCRNDWGYIYREKPQWDWIFYQSTINHLFEVYDIYQNNFLIGYFIAKKYEIMDFGFREGYEQDCILSVVREMQQKYPQDEIIFPIDYSSAICDYFSGFHLRFEERNIPDEGVMAIAINSKMLINIFAKVANLSYEYIKNQILKLEKAPSPIKLSIKDQQLLVNILLMGSKYNFSAENITKVLESSSLPKHKTNRMNDIDAL